MGSSEFVWGQGKISGYLAVFFSTLCLGGVLCFHFPEYLTSPELREVYDVGFLRRVLAFFLGFSFVLALISFFLAKRKVLSLTALTLVHLSLFLGGSEVEVPESVSTNYYWGLDWFILDLLILTLVFIPIERTLARIRDQKILRNGWRTDLAHFFVSHLLIQLTSFMILSPALFVSRWLADGRIQDWVQSQNMVFQFFAIVVIADLTQYWVHRAFHQWPLLWRFHKIHHSVEEMDWLAGSRLHLVDIVVTRGLTLIPIFCLGFSLEALKYYLVFVAFWATFIHANFRLAWLGLTQFLATPIYHHWHHAADKEALDKNFAVHLPLLDKIFGTYYLPKGEWPKNYGLAGEKVPDSYLGQTLEPFKRKSL